ncbi:hypothetical protein GTG28_20750 [Vibrio sp. OCN044]|uniref:Uncharacterized protein n=1 Tax=Vibrio tetraodonis subsp. pristinus TaxID=2695891 RepID=A0A6L8LZS4_9VIBR|nr:hypothetical protein [Vibrio tetraodonis]MYM61634.1 hypothetical protein [Vibrio tetraodonis subsp. pristinus]
MSTLYVDQILALNKESLPENLKNVVGFAWANWSSATIGIDNTFNVSSIVRSSEGDSRIHFIKKPTKPYVAVSNANRDSSTLSSQVNSKTSDYVQVVTFYANTGVRFDCNSINLICMGGQ